MSFTKPAWLGTEKRLLVTKQFWYPLTSKFKEKKQQPLRLLFFHRRQGGGGYPFKYQLYHSIAGCWSKFDIGHETQGMINHSTVPNNRMRNHHDMVQGVYGTNSFKRAMNVCSSKTMRELMFKSTWIRTRLSEQAIYLKTHTYCPVCARYWSGETTSKHQIYIL